MKKVLGAVSMLLILLYSSCDQFSLLNELNNTYIDYSTADLHVTGSPVTESPITGSFTIINNGAAGGNYDISFQIYASTDSVVGDSDFLLDSGLTTALAAGETTEQTFSSVWPAARGTYYLVVQVDSPDDEDASNNQTSTTTAIAISDPPPANVDYVVDSVSSPAGPVSVGTAISETFTYANQGSAGGEDPVYWTAYVSSDRQIDGGDTKVDSGQAAALLSGETSSAIDIDAGSWPVESGIYYLIVELSAPDEGVVRNNTLASSSVSVYVNTLDYIVTGVTGNYPTVVSGDPLSEQFDVLNASDDTGGDDVNWTAYASADTTVDAGDAELGTGTVAAPAALSETTGIALSGTWSVSAGSYYLIVEVSAADETTGNDDNNTFAAGPVRVVELSADVDYESVSVTSTGNPGQIGGTIAESFTFQNTGTDGGALRVSWYAYTSPDEILSSDDERISTGTTAPLDGGATSESINISGTWPDTAGTYYLIVAVSAGDENDTVNNAGVSGAFEIHTPGAVDYAVTAVSEYGGTAMTGGTLAETFSIKNFGDTNGTEEIVWTAYASVDTVINTGTDVEIDTGTELQLDAGATAAGIDITGNWPGTSGTYYLVIEISAADETGAQENNNTGYSGPFTIVDPPNYSVTAVAPALPADSQGGTSFSVDFTISETSGNAGTEAIEYAAYLSLDAGIGNDTVMAQETLPPLDGNEESNISFDYSWPDNSGGEYYIIIEVNSDDDASDVDDMYVSSRYIVYN